MSLNRHVRRELKTRARVLESNRAQIGVIIVVLFISVFVVAIALTGTVLRTLIEVQEGVEETGESTERNVSIPPSIENIVLTCDIPSGTLREVVLTTRIPPGGEPVDYKDIMISWHSGDDYVRGINYDSDGIYHNLSGFDIRELKGDGDAVLDEKEIIEIMIHLGDYSIGEDEEFRVALLGSADQSESVNGVVPSPITRKKYVL